MDWPRVLVAYQAGNNNHNKIIKKTLHFSFKYWQNDKTQKVLTAHFSYLQTNI